MKNHRVIKITVLIIFCLTFIILFSSCTQSQPSEKNKVVTSTPISNISLQIQFTGDIDLAVSADIFDLDLFDTSEQTIKELHKKNKKVFCYINVGAYENWRPDKNLFPSYILGNDYKEWPGEKWLDIRKLNIIAPIIQERLNLCQQKGFDGVEPDNIDGYTNNTGFTITYQDQLKYNKWLANEAKKRNLSIGLKNNGKQIKDLLPYYDWAMVEDCYADKFCDQFKPFIQANKPVFQVEYTDNILDLDKLCSNSKKLGYKVILKSRKLDAWRQTCN